MTWSIRIGAWRIADRGGTGMAIGVWGGRMTGGMTVVAKGGITGDGGTGGKGRGIDGVGEGRGVIDGLNPLTAVKSSAIVLTDGV